MSRALELVAGTRRVRWAGAPRPATWSQCAFCEASFRTTPSDLARSKRPMCSQACAELDAMLQSARQAEVG